MHDEPLAGRGSALYNDGAERGDEATAEARRVDEAEPLGERDQIDVGMGNRDVLGKRAYAVARLVPSQMCCCPTDTVWAVAVSTAKRTVTRSPTFQRCVSGPMARSSPPTRDRATWGRWMSERGSSSRASHFGRYQWPAHDDHAVGRGGGVGNVLIDRAAERLVYGCFIEKDSSSGWCTDCL